MKHAAPTEEDLANALKDFIDWWDEWVNSENPTELDDPPVEHYKAILNRWLREKRAARTS